MSNFTTGNGNGQSDPGIAQLFDTFSAALSTGRNVYDQVKLGVDQISEINNGGIAYHDPMSRRNDGFNGNPNLYNGYANQPYTPSYGYGYEEPSVTPGGNWNMSGITLNNNPQSINPNAGYFGFWNPRYGRG